MTLTTNEKSFLNHMTMFGSDGYPVSKLNTGKWIIRECFGVKGTPVVYRTKKAAFAQVEAYLDTLRARLAGRL